LYGSRSMEHGAKAHDSLGSEVTWVTRGGARVPAGIGHVAARRARELLIEASHRALRRAAEACRLHSDRARGVRAGMALQQAAVRAPRAPEAAAAHLAARVRRMPRVERRVALLRAEASVLRRQLVPPALLATRRAGPPRRCLRRHRRPWKLTALQRRRVRHACHVKRLPRPRDNGATRGTELTV
jgi:hypothetical protein